MAREFSRHDKVKKALMREISEAITTSVKDPRLADQLISVTDLELSSDFSTAKVFVSIFVSKPNAEGGADAAIAEILTILNEAAPKMQSVVGRRLQLRNTTKLTFHLDTSLERGVRVSSLLHKLSQENQAL